MNKEIEALRAGFDMVHKELLTNLRKFEDDLRENPDNYQGFTSSDAYVWFIEGFGG